FRETGFWPESLAGLPLGALRPVCTKLFLRRELTSRCKRGAFGGWRSSSWPLGPGLQRGQLRIHRFASADVLQFGFQFAIGSLAQVFEFFGFELAHFARLDIQHQRAIAYA